MRDQHECPVTDEILCFRDIRIIWEDRLTCEVKTRLLASVQAGRLVVLCGAGLSMASPSDLPSAEGVAELCFDKYQQQIDPHFDTDLRGNLEAIADHFFTLDMLQTVFIDTLVPWQRLVRTPNRGHAAIADFLITRVAEAGISSNYDMLIERCAWDYGFDFKSALDGDEATLDSQTQSPLLKLHGCAHRDRRSTIWTPSQLGDSTVSDRIEKSKTWMAAHLRQKDLLIIGFWSDWQYLNRIISSALQNVMPISVTVVDQADTHHLQQKAPDLWALLNANDVSFFHVQESGSDVLDELRRAFSRNYLRQVLEAGRKTIEQESGSGCDPSWLDVEESDSETLYGWRRDAEGVHRDSPATKKRPENSELLGFFHLLLRRAGAKPHTDGYEMSGRTIRVINGRGASLSSLRSEFIKPPAMLTADVVVAVTAVDIGLPDNIVRTGRAGDFIRPEPVAKWFDMASAREELRI